jgi:transposase-like protein
MARKRYKAEEIVAKLRQVLLSQGQAMADAIRQIGVSEVTYYRWRQEFGGLQIEQVKRLKPGSTRISSKCFASGLMVKNANARASIEPSLLH